MNISRSAFEERVLATLGLLRQAKRKGEIKRAIKARFGCSARSVERYLAVARLRLLDEWGQTAPDVRGESIATYRQLAADPYARPADRRAAQARLDRLLGVRPAAADE